MAAQHEGAARRATRSANVCMQHSLHKPAAPRPPAQPARDAARPTRRCRCICARHNRPGARPPLPSRPQRTHRGRRLHEVWQRRLLGFLHRHRHHLAPRGEQRLHGCQAALQQGSRLRALRLRVGVEGSGFSQTDASGGIGGDRTARFARAAAPHGVALWFDSPPPGSPAPAHLLGGEHGCVGAVCRDLQHGSLYGHQGGSGSRHLPCCQLQGIRVARTGQQAARGHEQAGTRRALGGCM